jgi:hypothetical protein
MQTIQKCIDLQRRHFISYTRITEFTLVQFYSDMTIARIEQRRENKEWAHELSYSLSSKLHDVTSRKG